MRNAPPDSYSTFDDCPCDAGDCAIDAEYAKYNLPAAGNVLWLVHALPKGRFGQRQGLNCRGCSDGSAASKDKCAQTRQQEQPTRRKRHGTDGWRNAELIRAVSEKRSRRRVGDVSCESGNPSTNAKGIVSIGWHVCIAKRKGRSPAKDAAVVLCNEGSVKIQTNDRAEIAARNGCDGNVQHGHV